MRHCTKCGAELKDDTSFCPKCGAPVKSKEISNIAESMKTDEKNLENVSQPKDKKPINVKAIIGILVAIAVIGAGIFAFIYLRTYPSKLSGTFYNETIVGYDVLSFSKDGTFTKTAKGSRASGKYTAKNKKLTLTLDDGEFLLGGKNKTYGYKMGSEGLELSDESLGKIGDALDNLVGPTVYKNGQGSLYGDYESKYIKAEQLFNEGNYSEAESMFWELDGYGNSKALANECTVAKYKDSIKNIGVKILSFTNAPGASNSVDGHAYDIVFEFDNQSEDDIVNLYATLNIYNKESKELASFKDVNFNLGLAKGKKGETNLRADTGAGALSDELYYASADELESELIIGKARFNHFGSLIECEEVVKINIDSKEEIIEAETTDNTEYKIDTTQLMGEDLTTDFSDYWVGGSGRWGYSITKTGNNSYKIEYESSSSYRDGSTGTGTGHIENGELVIEMVYTDYIYDDMGNEATYVHKPCTDYVRFASSVDDNYGLDPDESILSRSSAFNGYYVPDTILECNPKTDYVIWRNGRFWDQNEEFVIWYSSDIFLGDMDLEWMDKDMLRIARNEIYARHGRRFKSEDLQNHFNSCEWYEGRIDSDAFNDNMLSEIEKANIKLIESYENR